MNRRLLGNRTRRLRQRSWRPFSGWTRARIRAMPWGSSLFWLAMAVLGWRRWQYFLCQPESYAQWWRSAYALGSASGTDPVLGLYLPELPLYNWLIRGVLKLNPGVSPLLMLQVLAVIGCLGILLTFWQRGLVWSAALWGFSPWVIGQGLEPMSELLGSWLILLGCLSPLPRRFYWLGLACGFTTQAWPLAGLLTGLSISQSWPRYRVHGLGLVGGSMLLMGLWSQRWPGIGSLTVWWQPETSWSLWLSWLAPLGLGLGLVLVRLGWPWNQRQQTLIALAILGSLGFQAFFWLGSGLKGEMWLQANVRFGLMILPCVCWVAGEVLAEIPIVSLRRSLAGLLVLGSVLLSVQTLQAFPQKSLAVTAAQEAGEWLRTHQGEIQTEVIMDSAMIAYFSRLPPHRLLSSTAAQASRNQPIPKQMDWIVINQAEPLAWSRSQVLQQYPEFAFQSRLADWDLVFDSQDLSLRPGQDPVEGQVVGFWGTQPAPSVRPLVRIWRRRS